MSKSNIEWTGHTWNPLAGCSVLSPGCKKCYAMRLAKRLGAMGNPLYKGLTQDSSAGAVWTGEVRKAPRHTLLEPLRRKKPTTYFVNSMSDLFHEDVPDAWIDEIFAVMALSPQHTFQVLTKRAARMREYLTTANDERLGLPKGEGERRDHICVEAFNINDAMSDGKSEYRFTESECFVNPERWPLSNVWLGVSIERQQEADERVRPLLDTPAAVRFISAEPLLAPIDLSKLCILPQKPGSVRAGIHLNALKGQYCESGVAYTGDWDINGPSPPVSERRKLDWVIVGGESGHNHRDMDPAWAWDIIKGCSQAGVAVFMKQMAGKKPIPVELFVREMPERAA